MQYVSLVKQFGGLNTAASPEQLPVGMAQEALNVDMSGGTIQPRKADVLYATSSGPWSSIYQWGSTFFGSADEVFTFAEWGGRLFRANYRPDATKAVPQYTTRTNLAASSDRWDAAGIAASAVALTAGVGAAGAPNGGYNYYVTFINGSGDESPPSPAASVTLAAQRASLSAIPIGYGTGDITNGLPTVTNVTNIASYRVGMRIVTPGGGIPADTHITAIGATTLTLSNNATATTAGVTLQDAQVSGRRIYRSGGTVASTLLVTEIADVTTTTYTDNAADTALGLALTTTGYTTLPVIGGFDVSPAGVLAGIEAAGTTGEGDAFVFSEVGGVWLTKVTYTIAMQEPAGKALWALDRFVIMAQSGVFAVIGDSAATYELLRADGRAPSLYYFPVDMGDSVWFPSSPGVMAYDGTSLRCISRDFLAADTAFASQYGALGCVRWGERFFAFSSESILEYNPRNPLSPWVTHTGPKVGLSSADVVTCVCYSGYLDSILVATDDSGSGNVWKLMASTACNRAWRYVTGYLMKDERGALKTFRATVICGVGPWTSYVTTDPLDYVSTAALGRSPYIDTWAGVNDGEPNPYYLYQRRKAWQPSGYKGRGLVVVLGHEQTGDELIRQAIDEIGVWVGDQRGRVP